MFLARQAINSGDAVQKHAGIINNVFGKYQPLLSSLQ